jgi:hypothetical protein
MMAGEKERRSVEPSGLDDLTKGQRTPTAEVLDGWERGPVWRRSCFSPLPRNNNSCLFPSYSLSFPRSSFRAFPTCAELCFHAPPFHLNTHIPNHVSPTRVDRRNNRLGPKRSANMPLSI